jgi:hypothetical protein
MGRILRWLRAGLYGLAALWAALTFGFGPVKENPSIMTLAAFTPFLIVHGLFWVISAFNNGAKSLARLCVAKPTDQRRGDHYNRARIST